MTAQEALLRQYQKSYERLLKRIAAKEARGSWAGYERRLLQEIVKAVRELDKAAVSALPGLVDQAYTASAEKAAATLGVQLSGGLNTRAISLIIQNAVDSLVQANHYFGRHVQDRLREIGLEATAEKLSMGQTIPQARKRIIEMLETEGLQAPVGSKGNFMRLESYAALVARTTTREATNTATLDITTQYGHDLVRFSEHYPTCEVCAPVQGRVFSISGKDPRFPALSEVPGFDQDFKTIHPNCRHVLVPVVWGLLSPEEQARDLANAKKPVRGDTRSAEEVDLYNAQQSKNRQMWADRRQWERYKVVLGEDAPKTFSGFRRVKHAGTEKWQYMRLDYTRRARLISNPGLALPNAEVATAADDKFTRYLFNPNNPDGWAKGVAFDSRLGYNKDNWQELRKEILKRSRLYSASHKGTNKVGIDRYEQKIIIYGLKDTPANVIVGWAVDGSETWMSTTMLKEVD